MKFENVEYVIPMYEDNTLAQICCHHENLNTKEESFFEQIFMDRDGNIVAKFKQNSPFFVKQLSSKYNHLFIISEPDNTYSIVSVNPDYTYTVLNSYEDIEFGAEDGCFAVKHNNLWGFVDENGAELIKTQYDDYRCFSNGLAVVCKNEKWNYINKQNEVIKPLENNDIETYDNNLEESEDFPKPIQKTNGKFVLVESDGKEISEEYDNIEEYSLDGLYTVKQGRNYGYINKKGVCVITPQYHKWSDSFYGGFAVVTNHDLSKSIINKSGELLLNTNEDQKVFNIGNGSFLIEQKDFIYYELIRF